MSKPNTQTREANCTCGKVSLALNGAPILTAACYCDSCQEAANYLEALPEAPPITETDGGTHFVIQRKDRIRCQRGQEHLRAHRLSPDSPTRRVVASCCNSPMFLEFTNGHWLSVYKNRIDPADQPPIDIRTMTMYRRAGVEFDDHIPSPKKHTFGFMWKLLTAWVAMGFKTPKIDYVNGEL